MIKLLYKIVANIDAQDIGITNQISNTIRLKTIPFDQASSTDNIYTLIHGNGIQLSEVAVCLLYKELFFNLKRISNYLKLTDSALDEIKRSALFKTIDGMVLVDYDICDKYTKIFQDIITRTSFLIFGIDDIQNGMFSFV